jgi:rRNA maturation RNase YbeY
VEVKIEVSFLSPKEIQQINKERRGKDYTPAVLSFSYHEPIEEGILLGEVLICKSEAGKLAKKNKLTEDEQISALIIHGIRNILGKAPSHF